MRRILDLEVLFESQAKGKNIFVVPILMCPLWNYQRSVVKQSWSSGPKEHTNLLPT